MTNLPETVLDEVMASCAQTVVELQHNALLSAHPDKTPQQLAQYIKVGAHLNHSVLIISVIQKEPNEFFATFDNEFVVKLL